MLMKMFWVDVDIQILTSRAKHTCQRYSCISCSFRRTVYLSLILCSNISKFNWNLHWWHATKTTNVHETAHKRTKRFLHCFAILISFKCIRASSTLLVVSLARAVVRPALHVVSICFYKKQKGVRNVKQKFLTLF